MSRYTRLHLVLACHTFFYNDMCTLPNIETGGFFIVPAVAILAYFAPISKVDMHHYFSLLAFHGHFFLIVAKQPF